MNSVKNRGLKAGGQTSCRCGAGFRLFLNLKTMIGIIILGILIFAVVLFIINEIEDYKS